MGKSSKRQRTSPVISEELSCKKKRGSKVSKQLLLSECPLNQAKVSKTAVCDAKGPVEIAEKSQTSHSPNGGGRETPLSPCEIKFSNVATNTESPEAADLKELKTLFVKQCVLFSQTMLNIFSGQQSLTNQLEMLCKYLRTLTENKRLPSADGISQPAEGRDLQSCKISLSIFQNQLNYGKWHSTYRAKSSISSLLRCDFHAVDLQSVTKLSSPPNWQNFLLSFQQNIIPQMLLKSASLLHRFGIRPKKVYYEPPIVAFTQTRGARTPHIANTVASSTRPRTSEQLALQLLDSTSDFQLKESFSELALSEKGRLISALKELIQDFENTQDSSVITSLQNQNAHPDVPKEKDVVGQQIPASTFSQLNPPCSMDFEEQSVIPLPFSTPLPPSKQADRYTLEVSKSSPTAHAPAQLSAQTGDQISDLTDFGESRQSNSFRDLTVLEAVDSSPGKAQKILERPLQSFHSSPKTANLYPQVDVQGPDGTKRVATESVCGKEVDMAPVTSRQNPCVATNPSLPILSSASSQATPTDI